MAYKITQHAKSEQASWRNLSENKTVSVNLLFHLPKILFFVIAIESVRCCTKMSTKRCETSEIAKLIVHSAFKLQ